MEASTEPEARAVTELVHRVFTAGVPHIAFVTASEREHEVVTSSKELRAEAPFFGAEASEFELVFVLNYEQS